MVATRTADGCCGPGHVYPPLSPTGTEDGQGGGGGGRELKFTAAFQEIPPPPPQAAGAVYYEMDTWEDDGSAPAAGRPAPLMEVMPDPVVPQLGRDIVDNPHVMELYWWEQLWRHGVVSDSEAARRLAVDVPKHKAEYEQPVQVARG